MLIFLQVCERVCYDTLLKIVFVEIADNYFDGVTNNIYNKTNTHLAYSKTNLIGYTETESGKVSRS